MKLKVHGSNGVGLSQRLIPIDGRKTHLAPGKLERLKLAEVEDPPAGLPSRTLARHVQMSLSHPAIVFPASLVQQTMDQLKTGIPLIHVAPYQEFQVPYSLDFFLGATYHGNPNETEHLHPAQAELYIPVKGTLQVKCSYGLNSAEYLVQAGDVLLVPPGRWHFVHWAEPGWCWVVKGPNNLTGDAAKVIRKNGNGS